MNATSNINHSTSFPIAQCNAHPPFNWSKQKIAAYSFYIWLAIRRPLRHDLRTPAIRFWSDHEKRWGIESWLSEPRSQMPQMGIYDINKSIQNNSVTSTTIIDIKNTEYSIA
jgi:hypothetical protein